MGPGISGLQGIGGPGGSAQRPTQGGQSFQNSGPLGQYYGPQGSSGNQRPEWMGGLSQAKDALRLGTMGASFTGNPEMAGYFGDAGGALGAGMGLYNISQGNANPLEMVNTGKQLYDLYNTYLAAQTAGTAGAAGAAGTAAAGSGAAAGGAGSAAAGAGMGALGGGIVALGAYFGEKDSAKQAKEQYGHMNETMGALRDRGVDMRKLDPSLWYKPLDQLSSTTTVDGNTGQRNSEELLGGRGYGIDQDYIEKVLGGDARGYTGRSAYETGRDLLLQGGLSQSSPYMKYLNEIRNMPQQPNQYGSFGAGHGDA